MAFMFVIGGNVTSFFVDEDEGNEKRSYKF